MNQLTSKRGVYRIAICFLLLSAFAGWVSPQHAIACQDTLEIGDNVELDFLQNRINGEVVGFTGTNWPRVKFEFRGQELVQPFPPSRIKKIPGSSKSANNITGHAPSLIGKMRTWSDATGKFKVEAQLVSEQNGQVELKKVDGRVVTLAVTKLSSADQDYLKQLKLAESTENPFAGGESKVDALSSSDTATTKQLMKPIEPDTDANEITLTAADWKVVPDPATAEKFSNRVINPANNLSGNSIHSRLTEMVISPNRLFAALTSTNPFDEFSELISIDLAKANAYPNRKIPQQDCQVLAISPTGSVLSTAVKGRGAESGRLDFWSLEDDQLSHKTAWKTAGFHDRQGFSPTRGLLLDDNRLLTFGRKAILWDIDAASPKYSYQIAGPAAISPNHKYVAVTSQDAIWIVGIDAADVLGKIESRNHSIGGMAFSPNGKSLAGFNSQSGEIRVWDLTNGDLIRQMYSPIGAGSSIDWVGDKYLIINQQCLMDVELGSNVWDYQIPSGSSMVSSGAGRFWIVTKDKITPIRLAPQELDRLTDKFDPDELLILKPGAVVAIEIELPFSQAEKQAIRDLLCKQLEDKGVTVDDSAGLKLIAKVKKGQRQSSEMTSFTDPLGIRGTEKIGYTPNTSTIALQRGEAVLWQKSRTDTVTGILTLKENESAQQAANRVCKPKPGFFKTIELPAYLAALPGDQPLGVSRITSAGIQ